MKVLLCEDDSQIREGLAEILRNEGYTVLEVSDGAQALKMFQDERPDFLCLDIMLPGQSGYDICRRVREQDSSVPIMFISAKSEEIDRVLGLELGGDDYLVKPFGVNEVISRIRAITRRCYQVKKPVQDEFLYAGWIVKPAELKAEKLNSCVDLSLRDVQILHLLYRERGRVVTRDRIFDECWDLHHVPNSRTLDQHISKLRRKLAFSPEASSQIETVHGLGYRYGRE